MLAQATIRGRFRSKKEFLDVIGGNYQKPIFDSPGLSGWVTVWYGEGEFGPLKLAGSIGEVKILAHPKLLLIDWDKPKPPAWARLAGILRNVGLTPEWVRMDKTERGWHVIVKTYRKLEKGETVALQLLLGSDPKREVYNLCRALSGVKSNRWNLLFKEKLK